LQALLVAERTSIQKICFDLFVALWAWRRTHRVGGFYGGLNVSVFADGRDKFHVETTRGTEYHTKLNDHAVQNALPHHQTHALVRTRKITMRQVAPRVTDHRHDPCGTNQHVLLDRFLLIEVF